MLLNSPSETARAGVAMAIALAGVGVPYAILWVVCRLPGPRKWWDRHVDALSVGFALVAFALTMLLLR